MTLTALKILIYDGMDAESRAMQEQLVITTQ